MAGADWKERIVRQLRVDHLRRFWYSIYFAWHEEPSQGVSRIRSSLGLDQRTQQNAGIESGSLK